MGTSRSAWIATILGALATTPAVAVAQLPPTVWVVPRSDAAPEGFDTFGELLDRAKELKLTGSQVKSIEKARDRLNEKNERLVAQIRDAEIWGSDDPRTAAEDSLRLEVMRDTVRTNAEAAVAEVRALLTEEQRRAAEGLLSAERAVPPVEPVADAPADTAAQNGKERRPPVTLTVENQSIEDMVVYIQRGGQRQRLGMVTGMSRSALIVPPTLVFGITTVSFLISPIGGSYATYTEAISVSPGDAVVLRIPPT